MAQLTPIFRVITKNKLYVCEHGRLLDQWLDTVDFVLFTDDGQITNDELKATYMISRHQGVRIQYRAWRAHCPEPYDRTLIFKIDARGAWSSQDAKAWKVFTRANHTKVVKMLTYRFSLAKRAEQERAPHDS
jgi:hypothetical protein